MMKKVLSVFLCVLMIASLTATPSFAADSSSVSQGFQSVIVKAISLVMEGLTGFINGKVKESDNFVEKENFKLDNFYAGTETTLSKPAEGARWALGYDTTSLIPENLSDYKLYLGGFMSEQNFFTNSVKGVYDDMKVRTIALSDGSGRGISVFVTVDCIGLTNTDIRTIRGLLKDFAAQNGINSINIFSTHCHSCIDTQGLWTDSMRKIPKNLAAGITGSGNLEQGTDEKYMQFLFQKVQGSIESAVSSMKTGTMTFTQKDIGNDYFSNKNRQSATALISDLTRLTFTPDDKSAAPTIIANMAAHPDIVGLPTSGDDSKGHMISGDYVYYIGQTLNEAGYNFMFFNGAICGIYIGRGPSNDGVQMEKRLEISQRYGREIGRMLLALSMTKQEIENDEFLRETGDTPEQMASDEYTLWYQSWQPAKETEIEPLLNVTVKSVQIPVTNNVMLLAGKLKLANHTVIKDGGKYYISSEIGLVSFGSHKAVMIPGELCQDLVCGGASLTAEGSISSKSFSQKTIREIFGEDTLVFGLANDAIGYIVPDNDYCMGLAYGHYHELLSLGKKTASTLISALETIE